MIRPPSLPASPQEFHPQRSAVPSGLRGAALHVTADAGDVPATVAGDIVRFSVPGRADHAVTWRVE
jgi:hypothetical protein